MIVRLADEQDMPGFLDLAGQVEHWFGPMVHDLGFRAAVGRHIRRGMALVAVGGGADLLGGLLFGAKPPVYQVRWLVVSGRVRGQGVGRASRAEAMRRWVPRPPVVEVVTFGAHHPGAGTAGAPVLYEQERHAP